jgi:mannose-6-phosphate isomerase-like protein (cupin superfamily)
MSDSNDKTTKADEFWTGERCFIRELVNSPEIQDFSLAETRVEPGVTTELHKLSVNEWYIILSGEGQMEIDGKPACAVLPGDVVAIAAETSQCSRHSGNVDLLFQCICLPRFTPDCYVSLEKESARDT